MPLSTNPGGCYNESMPRRLIIALMALIPAIAGAAPNDRFRLPDSSQGLLAFLPTHQNHSQSLGGLFDAARRRGALVPGPGPVRAKKRNKRALIPPQSKRFSALVRKMDKKRHKIDKFDPLILKYSEKHRLNPRLVKAIIAAESEFRFRAISPAGAMGLMQLMPKTAEFMGVPRNRLFDPEANIRAGASYLAWLFKIIYRRNNIKGAYANAPKWIVRRVLAAYNAGLRFLRPQKLYRETRHYLAKIRAISASSISDIRNPLPTVAGGR